MPDPNLARYSCDTTAVMCDRSTPVPVPHIGSDVERYDRTNRHPTASKSEAARDRPSSFHSAAARCSLVQNFWRASLRLPRAGWWCTISAVRSPRWPATAPPPCGGN